MATNIFSNRSADNFRMFRSGEIAAPTDGQYNIIKIPRFALVKGAKVWVTTACSDAAASITIGFVGNATTAVATQFANITSGLSATAPFMVSGSGAYWFQSAPGYITVTTLKNSGTFGTFIVFIDFTIIH